MSERTASDVAYQALNLARQNENRIESHEDICAIRYQTIEEKLTMLFKIIAWAGGSAFLLIMGVLAFLGRTQFESINALQKATAQRTEILERERQPVIIQRDMGATIERQQR